MSPRERLLALEQFGIKLGLDNITTLLNALHRPDRSFRSIHVAGTNGKGSVTAMVERGLRAAGHRTGRYTSPHLAALEERIALDGEPVEAASFDLVTGEVLRTVEHLQETGALPHPPTFFEATTAIGFEIFRRRGVTAAVVEVGLGGRFDATNVITPSVCAITSIARDHEQYLGHTLDAIAFEKAGIIKPGVPVVVGPQAPEVQTVIEEVARMRQAPIVEARPAPDGEPITLALHGEHQRINAAIAVEVLRQCPEVDRSALIAALTEVQWPGRLEWLRLADGRTLLLDAAHNPAGARALASYVSSAVGTLPMVIGVMRDKDIEAMLDELAPAVSRFVATAIDSPRALPAQELAARIRDRVPAAACEWHADVDAAMAALAHEPQAMAAGSMFLIGPLRAALVARGAVPVRYPSNASPFFLR